MTPIADLKPGMLCSVAGFVTGIGEVREFQRDDGTMGCVANIHISDETGKGEGSPMGGACQTPTGP